MTAAELKQSIKASEGRVILSENVAPRESFIEDITNSEIARAFGADLILLNGVDVLNPVIFGLDVKGGSFVDELHRLVGRPIGVNLEPVDLEADMAEDRCLAGTEYAIDYVYYAQNEQQKADAAEYYSNSPKILGYDDISIYEGDTDLLSNVTISDNADIDFSVTDSPQFSIKEETATLGNGLTSVDLLCKGKNDLNKLANLPDGEYSLHYTALPKGLKYDSSVSGVEVPSAKENYNFDRKTVNLTIKEKCFRS